MDTSDLRQVGEFGPNIRKSVIKAPKSPLDICTVFSIYPDDIIEHKHTIEPGHFHIRPGTYESPSILVVGGSSWWRDVSEFQPILEIPVSSVQVAESLIRDYVNGMIAVDMGGMMPGLSFALGEVSVTEIKLKYRQKLDEMKAKQDAWFLTLTQMADSLWARSNGNPLSISKEMRIAARSLGIEDKPWLQDFKIAAMVKCQACGSLKDPNYPVCPHCKAIDMTNPRAKDLKFAQ